MEYSSNLDESSPVDISIGERFDYTANQISVAVG